MSQPQDRVTLDVILRGRATGSDEISNLSFGLKILCGTFHNSVLYLSTPSISLIRDTGNVDSRHCTRGVHARRRIYSCVCGRAQSGTQHAFANISLLAHATDLFLSRAIYEASSLFFLFPKCHNSHFPLLEISS